MVFETRIGHALDQGRTFQDTVLPIMVGFSLLATLGTLLLMRPLRKRAEWNAALAGTVCTNIVISNAEGSGVQMAGSLGGSSMMMEDLYD